MLNFEEELEKFQPSMDVEKVEDVLAVGDEIKVKVYEIDNQDRINLTMKDLEENKENKEEHVEE